MPPTDPDDLDLKFLAKLFEMNREVDRCESEYLAKKEAASAAKKRWEAAQMGLNGFIRKNDAPLFDRAESRPAAEPVVVSDPAPAPEAWRKTPVNELAKHGLSDTIVAKLAEAGLPTVGAIADHTSKGRALTEIPGVGPAKADQIDEALAKFWAAQPPADAPNPPAAGPPTAPDARDGAPDEVDRRPIRGETNDLFDEAFGDAEDEQWSPPEPDPSHTPLERLEIDPRHLVKLAAAGITSVESMLDYVANVGHVSEIVGKKGGRAIDEAVDRWASAGPAAAEAALDKLLEAESDADAAGQASPEPSKRAPRAKKAKALEPSGPADLFVVRKGHAWGEPRALVRAPSTMAALHYAKTLGFDACLTLEDESRTAALGLAVVEVDRAGAVVATPVESDPSKFPVQEDAGQYQSPAGKPKRARKAKAEVRP